MPRETLGYVKLEWTCPKCGTRNPGPEKTCMSCGAPQPQHVAFEQPSQQEIIKDQQEIEKAEAGADIHCGFCGTRNPAGSEVCSQCGADLVHGVRREAGRVVGAFGTGPVRQIACPNCGTKNPETALKCVQCGSNLKIADSMVSPQPAGLGLPVKPKQRMPGVVALAVIGLLCLAVFVGFLFISANTQGVAGVVGNVSWTTQVVILGLQPVEYSGWRDEIPSEAQVGSCTSKIHHIQDDAEPDAIKVCGTPYSVDKGSGFAQVVQDCRYEVMQDYCTYTAMDWRQVDVVELHGRDNSPVWAEPQLAVDQRIGEKGQTFTIQFETSKGQYSYNNSDSDLFQQLQPGSEWILNINSFGSIVSVERVQ